MQRNPRDDLGREAPRAVTEDDIDELRESLQSLKERLDLMNELMAPAMASALTQAIRSTLQDATFWDSALDQFGQAVGRRSVKGAGNFTLGLFKSVPRLIFSWVVIFALVYQLGGMTMLTSFIKSWFVIKQ